MQDRRKKEAQVYKKQVVCCTVEGIRSQQVLICNVVLYDLVFDVTAKTAY